MRGLQERGPVTALSPRRARLAVTGGVAAAVVGADQAATWWALADLHRPVHLLGPLGLALQYNRGSAFSLLAGSGAASTALAAAALVVVAALAWRAATTTAAVGFGLVIGGAVGNLADRAWGGHFGAVVDYITLSHWPTFNVADAAITAGVVILVATLVWGPRRGTSPAGPGHRSPVPPEAPHAAPGAPPATRTSGPPTGGRGDAGAEAMAGRGAGRPRRSAPR